MSNLTERKFVSLPHRKEYRVIEQLQSIAHPFDKDSWYVDRSYLVWDGDKLMFKLSKQEFDSMFYIDREE